MPKYQTKPVTIEAKQLTADNAGEIAGWVDEGGGSCSVSHDNSINLFTQGGREEATVGDWIIQSAYGNTGFYIYHDDEFQKAFIFVGNYLPMTRPGH